MTARRTTTLALSIVFLLGFKADFSPVDMELFHIHGLEQHRLGYTIDDATLSKCDFTYNSFFDASPIRKPFRTCSVSGDLGRYILTLDEENRPHKIELRFESEEDIIPLLSDMYKLNLHDDSGYYRGEMGSVRYAYRPGSSSIHFLAMYVETY